jgi:hypothetical protein
VSFEELIGLMVEAEVTQVHADMPSGAATSSDR